MVENVVKKCHTHYANIVPSYICTTTCYEGKCVCGTYEGISVVL